MHGVGVDGTCRAQLCSAFLHGSACSVSVMLVPVHVKGRFVCPLTLVCLDFCPLVAYLCSNAFVYRCRVAMVLFLLFCC